MEAESDPLAVVMQPATRTSDIAEPRHVYIVDDDRMIRRALSFALQTAGFKVRAFISGRDFLDEVDSLPAGCVLLDMRMPEMDGIAVLDELGDRSRRFPVITITGHGDVDVAVRAMKHGSKDFLEKPFTDDTLLDVLNAMFVTLPAEVEADAERQNAVARVAGLTPRERDLLEGLIAGLSNKRVAIRLNVSVRTVEMHRSNLMEQLGVGSLAEAVRLAILAGVKPS